MELTLTGASLNSDKAISSAGSKVAKAGTCKHKNEHTHNHGRRHDCKDDKCCDKDSTKNPSNFQSLESIPVEKLLSNEAVLFSAILTTIKGGSFDSFRYLIDTVLDHEHKGNILKWGKPITEYGENDDAGKNCTSALGRRWDDGHTLIHWVRFRFK